MWRPLSRVASSRRLEEQSFIQFAIDRAVRFGIIGGDHPEVSSW